jgi:glycosyltransferase involved in cell wall biosynthesis
MKILFLTHYKWPHVGGVEKHVEEVGKILNKKGHAVTIVSEADIKYPHFKFIGIFFIWIWLFKNLNLIEKADIIHCHDVFIWYLPFCLIYPKKPVVTTIHGLEWDSPLNRISIFQKRLAARLSNKTIGIGKFLEKYLHIKFNLITYGAVSRNQSNGHKNKNTIVYVGRLEENTGLLRFLDWLKANPKYQTIFCGDGELRKECEKYGEIHGFTDPRPFYKKAEYCVPGGYLAALEALSYKCRLKLFWNNKIKEDYWNMSPFVRKDAGIWAKKQTWEKLANEYLDLYNSIK